KPILGPAVIVDRAPLAGLEQEIEIAIAVHESVEADRNQTVGWELAITGLPWRAQPCDQPFPMRLPKRIGRHVHPPQAAANDLKDLRIEEGEAASHECALKTALVIDECIGGDVALLPFKYRLRVHERRVAPPAPHCAGIARRRRMAISER